MAKTLNALQRNVLALAALLALSLIGILFLLPGQAHAAFLGGQLSPGDSNADVTILQTYLASDPSIYPEGLVTGFYGTLTTAAVARYQCANEIVCTGDAVTTGYGRVGPKTLASINARLSGGSVGASSVPFISSVGISTAKNSATISWNTNEATQGKVYYSTSPISLSEENGVPGSVGVSGSIALMDSAFRSSQSVTVSGLQANTLYYYVIYSNNAAGGVSVTWPKTFTTTP